MIELEYKEGKIVVVSANNTYSVDDFKSHAETNGVAELEELVGFVALKDYRGDLDLFRDMVRISIDLEVFLRQLRKRRVALNNGV